MRSLFNGDNIVWNALGKAADVIVLSLLAVVTSLPVLTIGASLTALYRVMFQESKDTEGYIIRSYFRYFKENFKKATLVWLICLVVALVLAADLYFCYILNMAAAKVLLVFFAVMAVLFIFLLHYLFPLLAIADAGIKRVLLLSFMLMIKEWWRTLFLVFITGIMIAVGVFVSGPFLLIAPGVITFFHAILFRDIFEKYNLREEEN